MSDTRLQNQSASHSEKALEMDSVSGISAPDKLAILGGKPVRTEPYPPWPVFDQRDIEAVTTVIQSGRWGGLPYPGRETAAFAKQFAAMQGGGFAVPMANGTVTMEVALRAANIGWGDEVIVPAYTFQATAYAPMAAGAIPVIVDIDPDTYCISPAAIEAAITEKTRAIIPVHLGAQMADMDAIMAIAERHNLIVIEDCAHAHGAKWKGQGAGTIGHFGSFSLEGSKILTTGEGGILLCRTQEMAEKVASLISCGRPPAGEEIPTQVANTIPQMLETLAKLAEQEQISTFGTNYRMTQMQAALGMVALQRLPEQIAQREEMVSYLEERLQEVPGTRLLKRDVRHTQRTCYRYIFAIDPKTFGAKHNEVCLALYMEGIPCWQGYPAMHRYNLFQPQLSRLPVPSAFPQYFDFKGMRLPEAERACEREAIWLDESVFRAGRQGVDDVVTAIAKIQSNTTALAVANTVKNLATKSLQIKPLKALMNLYISRSDQ
ncbi:MAG: DegT/DnrJ/EryC1/StrS family aminotransferase [Chroococcales cyanobacterium]